MLNFRDRSLRVISTELDRLRTDITDKGGGLLLYIGEYISGRDLKIDLESQIEMASYRCL